MNYFFSSLFRSKSIWLNIGFSILAGLITMDLLTYMLASRAAFDLWTVKITIGAAIIGAVIYGLFLRRHEKRDRQLGALLPGFIEERRTLLEKQAAAVPEFQTLCHQCRHFDHGLRSCVLLLRERKVHVRLSEDSRISHCLYWNLDDSHPVMQLTGRRPRAPEPPAVAPATQPDRSAPDRGNPT